MRDLKRDEDKIQFGVENLRINNKNKNKNKYAEILQKQILQKQNL